MTSLTSNTEMNANQYSEEEKKVLKKVYDVLHPKLQVTAADYRDMANRYLNLLEEELKRVKGMIEKIDAHQKTEL